MNFSNKDIERYYDISEAQYRQVWQLEKSRSLHYGYWDHSTKNLHEALLRINRIIADIAAINESDHVLDAGCGIGGSSLWLAENIKCKVLGISLSTRQIEKAGQLAKGLGLDKLVKFEKKDFTDTGYPDASFDIIWAIESFNHMIDKKQFTDEAYRLLKKGGRLVLVDFFKKDGLEGKDKAFVERCAIGWSLNDFAVTEKFQQQLEDAGFLSNRVIDITKSVWPSAKRLYYAWFPGAFLGFLYRLVHPNATKVGKLNLDTAFYQYKCFKRDLWQYNIVLALKA